MAEPAAAPPAPPSSQPSPPASAPAQTDEQRAEEARVQAAQAMQQRRDEAARPAPVIGAERPTYVAEANVAAQDVKPGPMTMAFAIGDLQIIEAYGKRYEVVGQGNGGVYVVDLEYSSPKPVYFLKG